MMKSMRNVLTIASTAGLLLGTVAAVDAQDGTNPNIGKDAPALEIAGWATEKSITQEELDKSPHVLEFWATWCPPCLESVPHLNEMSQRLEPFGLKVVGLSNESMEKVKPFAQDMGMTYYVAAGHEMEGLEFRGIPFAAAVGTDGKVAWAGHPMDPAFEKALWKMTQDFTPTALQPALAKAQDGPLGPAYAALGAVEHAKAKAARATIEGNLSLRLELAGAADGIDQYNALHATSELYEGVPGADKANARMKTLLEDPEVMKAVELQKPIQDLEAALRGIQAKAAKMQEEKSEMEVMEYYLNAILPVFEAFVKDNPEHPEAPQIKQAINQIETQLETLKGGAAAE